MPNEVHTLTLIDEGPWMIEFPPAVVLAFVNIFWRTTAPFICGDDDGRRFTYCGDERVVDNRIGGIYILSAMNAAIHLLETLARREFYFSAAAILHRQGAALYNVEGVARMIMQWELLAWF